MKSVVPPINFVGESNLHQPHPSVPNGKSHVLQHFYTMYKKYKPKIKLGGYLQSKEQNGKKQI
tara:strand:+ start:208 stop:396 length:189 start_codon:yes stop_codon:yes gene_type:complete